MARDVVTGFLVEDEEQVRGRPVGLGIDGTGALLIADDAGNTVWRVAAADGRVTDAPVETDRVARDPLAAVVQPAEQEDAASGNTPPETEGTAPNQALSPTTVDPAVDNAPAAPAVD